MERTGHKRRASSTFVAGTPVHQDVNCYSKIELISQSIQFDVIDDWSATVGCDSATFDLV